MDLPPAEPHALQLAMFWNKNGIKLLHTGEVIENNELLRKAEYCQDHGKLNSRERYFQSKLEWGDRTAGGDWSETDTYDRRNWSSQPYQSPFRSHGKGYTSDDQYNRKWVDRPHYGNWSYYPNEGKGKTGEATTRHQADPTDGDSTADPTAARDPPQGQESRGTHTATAPDTAVTDAPQAKPMPRMTRVIPTAGGSALLPAAALDDGDIGAEIEAAKQASLQQWPHMERIGTILDTDSPTTVFSKAFAGFETMEQTEIDDTLTALQNHVSEDIMAKVIQVVDEQVVPLKWSPQEPEQPTADLDTSRKSIQVPVQNQQHVPVSPRSVNPTAESTSQLERVLEQGNIPEQQQVAEIQVARPIAQRDTPMHLQEDEAGTPMVDEFPTPEGGWVSIDLANVQRLRTTEQGNPPPPEIVQETAE
eukprot:6490911-Amphidinium_carterae.2